MKNLTISDSTQLEILKQLTMTEELLARAATKVSGHEQSSEIWAMPDLGLPHNVTRMRGGFFTGALYTWTTSVPIVPVDATVNACGASVFKVNVEIESKNQFDSLVATAAEKASTETTYIWNFNAGNHFIIYGELKGSSILPDGRYIVLHAGSAEFKKQHNGLYPAKDNWYFHEIKVLEDKKSCRYLRYIEGKTASRFIELAIGLNEYNLIRLRFFASLIFGDSNIELEISNKPHYGMPSSNAVSIGCQWISEYSPFILLTAPNRPLFFIQPQPSDRNRVSLDGQSLILHPHGLGKAAVNSLDILYTDDSLVLNGKKYSNGQSIENNKEFELRSFDWDDCGNSKIPALIDRVLEQCPGEVVGCFKPIYSYYRGSSEH